MWKVGIPVWSCECIPICLCFFKEWMKHYKEHIWNRIKLSLLIWCLLVYQKPCVLDRGCLLFFILFFYSLLMYRIDNESYYCLLLTVSFISYVSSLTDCVDLSRSLMTEGISTCSSVSWTVNMSLSPPGGTMSLSMPRTWWANVSLPNEGALKSISVVSWFSYFSTQFKGFKKHMALTVTKLQTWNESLYFHRLKSFRHCVFLLFWKALLRKTLNETCCPSE